MRKKIKLEKIRNMCLEGHYNVQNPRRKRLKRNPGVVFKKITPIGEWICNLQIALSGFDPPIQALLGVGFDLVWVTLPWKCTIGCHRDCRMPPLP